MTRHACLVGWNRGYLGALWDRIVHGHSAHTCALTDQHIGRHLCHCTALCRMTAPASPSSHPTQP